jgi:hypothetical protein
MAPIRVSVSARIDAPPRALYDIIADYREGHPRIIPRPPFVALDVEEGGVGAGTVVRVQMRMLGRLETFRAVVTEPDPGRVLVETNDTGYVSTFTVVPEAGGERARVTIATEKKRRGGSLGALEARLVPRRLRPVYVRELELLAEAAGAAGIRPVPG